MDYGLVGRPPEPIATWVGTADINNFYGDGIVDALNAVRGNRGNQGRP